MKQITLVLDDPTIWAACSGDCNRHYPGHNVGNYYARAYTVRKWKRGPKCVNCDSPMRFLYEVKE